MFSMASDNSFEVEGDIEFEVAIEVVFEVLQRLLPNHIYPESVRQALFFC